MRYYNVEKFIEITNQSRNRDNRIIMENEYSKKRKLQIQDRMPQSDKDIGFGTSHITTNELLEKEYTVDETFSNNLHSIEILNGPYKGQNILEEAFFTKNILKGIKTTLRSRFRGYYLERERDSHTIKRERERESERERECIYTRISVSI